MDGTAHQANDWICVLICRHETDGLWIFTFYSNYFALLELRSFFSLDAAAKKISQTILRFINFMVPKLESINGDDRCSLLSKVVNYQRGVWHISLGPQKIFH
jgi:hypothetical protein